MLHQALGIHVQRLECGSVITSLLKIHRNILLNVIRVVLFGQRQAGREAEDGVHEPQSAQELSLKFTAS